MVKKNQKEKIKRKNEKKQEKEKKVYWKDLDSGDVEKPAKKNK